METLIYDKGILKLLDQTKLPHTKEYFVCNTYKDAGDSITKMIVRGAPLIGVTAAFGLVIGANAIKCDSYNSFIIEFTDICNFLKSTRPTAVNLSWAVDRVLSKVIENKSSSINEIKKIILDEAIKMKNEDIHTNIQIAINGNKVIKENWTILTHCNAGALATCGYGTALGVIRKAHESGKNISVYADETRPYLQGSRLTVWELTESNIPVTLICDNMAGHFINKGYINCIIVGADRIALNGDTANKIGTYTLSVLAKENKIPFYVAAPLSTIDFSIPDGSFIPIEERDKREVSHLNNIPITQENITIKNPAFDVTPNENITGIITEKGILTPPFDIKSYQS